MAKVYSSGMTASPAQKRQLHFCLLLPTSAYTININFDYNDATIFQYQTIPIKWVNYLKMIRYIVSLLILQTTCLHLTDDYTFLDLYHNNSGLHSFMQNLSNVFPNISSAEKCEEFNQIRYLRIGNSKPVRAAIICNIHARQVLTAEVCLNWAQQYLQSNNGDSSLADFGIALFYLANTNRDATIIKHECARKSIKGTDINRNFPTQFNFYKTSPQSEIYSGQAPINQPFTQCLQKLLMQEKPLLFIDLHTGENGGMFYQQGYNSRQDRQIMQIVNKNICKGNCRITTLARDAEAINGHLFADVKVRLNMKYSLLFEIYSSQQGKNCLEIFNPTTRQVKDLVVSEWTEALNLIIKEVRRRQKI